MTNLFERERENEKSNIQNINEEEESDKALVFWFRSQLQTLILKSISNGNKRVFLSMIMDSSENGFPSFYDIWFQNKLREKLFDRGVIRSLKEKYEGKEREVVLEESGKISSFEAEKYVGPFIEEVKALWEKRQTLH